MGIGTSIFALGAIPRFAVTAAVANVNLQTIGVILMVVGIAGLVVSFILWSSWGRRRTVADRRDDRAIRSDRSALREDETVVRGEPRTVRDDRYDDKAA